VKSPFTVFFLYVTESMGLSLTGENAKTKGENYESTSQKKRLVLHWLDCVSCHISVLVWWHIKQRYVDTLIIERMRLWFG